MTTVNWIDNLPIFERNVELPFGKMHLHDTISGELDLAVVTLFVGCLSAWKILLRDVIKP